ncbi:MAG: hypothetical protein N4A63_13750 [Vallitalea sp.]|jgi:hypothetical protein|nr:hypothetical protein [Vallitalea sp.]
MHEIDFASIKGYNKLGPNAQKFFISIYKKHISILGVKEKSKWIPISVEIENTGLKVIFANGEWLHYYANGTWG